MKKLLIALAAVVVAVASHAQGTIVFNNRLTALGVDAPITLEAPGGAGPGPSYSAGLYLGSGATATLIPGSVVTFRDGTSNPLLAKYINGLTVTVPNTAIEQQNVTVEMRAWITSAGSYDAASPLLRGSSGALVIAQLGGGANPNVANNLPSSFTGFVIPVVPEPSTIALGVLGAAALLFRRRK